MVETFFRVCIALIILFILATRCLLYVGVMLVYNVVLYYACIYPSKSCGSTIRLFNYSILSIHFENMASDIIIKSPKGRLRSKISLT